MPPAVALEAPKLGALVLSFALPTVSILPGAAQTSRNGQFLTGARGLSPRDLRSPAPGAIVSPAMRLRARLLSMDAPLPSVALGLVLAGAASILTGCGHPASVAECEELLARSAEIELRAQNITDPKVIAERTAAFRQARGQELLGHCAGKRITSRAMECVRKAVTVDEVYKCLD
jgi:hypothetical protein